MDFYRHVLAAVHFNFNLQRDVKHREEDGEATVRNVKVKQNSISNKILINDMVTHQLFTLKKNPNITVESGITIAKFCSLRLCGRNILYIYE